MPRRGAKEPPRASRRPREKRKEREEEEGEADPGPPPPPPGPFFLGGPAASSHDSRKSVRVTLRAPPRGARASLEQKTRAEALRRAASLLRDVTTTSAEREEEEEEEGREEREEREEEEKEKPVAAEASNTELYRRRRRFLGQDAAGGAGGEPARGCSAREKVDPDLEGRLPLVLRDSKTAGGESTSLSLETPRCFCFSPPSSSAPAGAASNRIAGGREEGETDQRRARRRRGLQEEVGCVRLGRCRRRRR